MVLEKKTINLPNAIALNEALLEQLNVLLRRMESSLAKCQKKYQENEEILSKKYTAEVNQSVQAATRPSYHHVMRLRQYPGFPYFKTRSGVAAQPNPEAIYRRSQNSLYPHDLLSFSRTQWTLADKTLLIHLVKDMINDFVKKQPNQKLVAGNSIKILVEVAEKLNFKINWERISDQIYDRHSPMECESMWRLVMHPNLKRGRWSDEEDNKLIQLVRENQFQNWMEISNQLGCSRSMFQCFLRYQSQHMPSDTIVKREKFTPQEDKRLLELVKEHRVGVNIPWATIARCFPTRSKMTLYNRYQFALRPNISKEKFSVEEDCLFLAALQEYGLDFQKIALEFPHRTTVQLRSHYNAVLKRNSPIVPWSEQDDAALMEMHKKGVTWAEMSKAFGTHTRQACRSRFVTISKFLKRNPTKTLKDVFSRKKSRRNGVTTANWATKLTEISAEAKITYTQSDVKKLASFAKLLECELDQKELVTGEKFTADEVSMLEKASKVREQHLSDVPLHRPTLVAFDKLRRNLMNLNEGEIEEESSSTATVEKDNFKKQFKALFYLPAILATMPSDNPSETTITEVSTIKTELGNVTISYNIN